METMIVEGTKYFRFTEQEKIIAALAILFILYIIAVIIDWLSKKRRKKC